MTITSTTAAGVDQLRSLPISLTGFSSAGSRRWLLGTFSALLYSDDDGESWQTASTPVQGLGDVPVPSVAWSANSLSSFSGVAFAGLNGAVLRSEDGGQCWTIHELPGPPSVVSRISCASDGSGLVLAATAQDGVYVSEDDGESWAAWNFGLLDLRVLDVVMAHPQLAFATTDSGLFASRNGGRSWTDLGFPQAAGSIVRIAGAGLSEGGYLLVAGTEGAGLWVCETTRFAWVQAAEHQQHNPVNDLWVGSVDDREALVLSATGSELWWARVSCEGLQGGWGVASVSDDVTCIGVAENRDADVPIVMVGTGDGSVLRIRELEDMSLWTTI